MAKLPVQSARFKRDYVAASAVIIFILILIAELTLAISIPLYLNREKAMALQVRRLNLLSSFDGTRNLAHNINPTSVDATAYLEVRLVAWNLDQLAPYLRSNAAGLSHEELTALQKSVNSMAEVLARIRRGYVFSAESRLDTSGYINSLLLRERELEKNNAEKKQ